MLTTLRIKNLALVSDLTIEFKPGYNAITGETGAGKSVLMGALSLVLGERADRSLIRAGADVCSVEAVFDLARVRAPIAAFLDENGIEPCEGGLLIVKRSLTASGSNRQFINGSPTTLAALGRLGGWLVDMHGPHDHQSLLHAPIQLDILDAFGGLREQREGFAALVRDRIAVDEAIRALVIDEKAYAQQLDLLRFQAQEIERAKLAADDEDALEQEHQRASNAARLLQLSSTALGLLAEEENNVLNLAGALGRALQDMNRLDPGCGHLLAAHEQAVALLQDLQSEISRYADHVEIEPVRLQELEERLDLIQSLKRKYGPTLADVVAFGAEARRKLIVLESRDEELLRLRAAADELNRKLLVAGGELSARRRKLIPKLVKAVGKHLAELGFKQSAFDVAIQSSLDAPVEKIPPASGYDSVEFQFAPNPGEPARPLRAIASSGELARVMLALKTALAAEDEIPVLVFDEVDANVGGETAVAVGTKMQQIARNRQVLCITHLAPVAARADAHLVVSKTVREGRTLSEIRRIEGDDRIRELARMLGGPGEAARRHAEALLAS